MLGVAAAGETRHARGTERPLHEGDGLGWDAGAQEKPPPPKTPCTYLTIRGQVLVRAVYMGTPNKDHARTPIEAGVSTSCVGHMAR